MSDAGLWSIFAAPIPIEESQLRRCRTLLESGMFTESYRTNIVSMSNLFWGMNYWRSADSRT
jgi:hypothetical protein